MTRSYLPLVLLIATCPFLASPGPARAAQAQFEALPLYPGGSHAVGYGVSRDGSTTVGLANRLPWPKPPLTLPAGQTEAAMWRNGQLTLLGDLPGDDVASFARAASADGSVIVGTGNWTITDASAIRNSPNAQAVRWVNGVITPLTDTGGLRMVQAQAVSADGSVVVGGGVVPNGTEQRQVAYRWSNGVATLLGDAIAANGVSADGSVVVGDGRDTQAFRWVNGVMTPLGSTPGNAYSSATAVSSDGRVVVGYAFGAAGSPAFRWENGVMSALGDFGAGGAANAVSGDGSVVVGWAGIPGAGDTVATIWDAAHGTRDLRQVLQTEYGMDLNNWRFVQATGVSDDGRTIVGYGFGPDTGPNVTTQAFRVTLPVPEPAALGVLLPAAAMVLCRRRR
jgi:probable HAF family extracellular repeat protein